MTDRNHCPSSLCRSGRASRAGAPQSRIAGASAAAAAAVRRRPSPLAAAYLTCMDGVSTDGGDFFSIQLRYAIATFLFGVVAYALAVAYQHFDTTGIWRSPPKSAPAASASTLHSLPFHLCAVVLALAGLWLLLLISAAACTTPSLPMHYVLFWVERDFVSASWTGMSWASMIAVLVVFPFAYLYEEAEGLTWQSGVVGRIIETGVVQILVSILFLGSIALLQLLLTGQPLTLSIVTSGVAFQLPGLILYLVYFRDGFQRMVVGAVALFEAPSHSNDPERLAAYEFALESILLQIQALSSSSSRRRRSTPDTLDALQHQLHDLQRQHGDAVRRRRRWQTLGRNLVAITLLILSLLLPGGIALRSLRRCDAVVLAPVRRLFGVRLRLDRSSASPVMTLAVDVALVLYLLAAVAGAALDSPSFRWMAGVQGRTRSPIQFMLARNTLLLVLCANLPAVSALLGVTRIDLETVFPDAQTSVSLIYCSTFLILEMVAALELIGAVVPMRRALALLFRLMISSCCCWRRRRRRSRHDADRLDRG